MDNSKLCVDKLCVSKLCESKLCVDKLCVDKLCVSKLSLCVSKLCGDKLCVSKLCVDKLCVRKLCVCVDKLCGSKLRESKLCVWTSCVWTGWRRREDGAGGSAEPKTRTPHKDAGKKSQDVFLIAPKSATARLKREIGFQNRLNRLTRQQQVPMFAPSCG